MPSLSRRREESRKAPIKPLEPGMMMSDTHVLDRINKEMESLTSRSRTGHNRSPEDAATSSKSTPSARIPKRDAPVDYAQVLFSNAPVIKRTPPTVEKKRNLVISSGLVTDNPNQLVFSKAHSSRLGMFLEKVSDKHRKLMSEHDCDSEVASPLYEESDHSGARSPFGVPQYARQPSLKYAPQKRPLPTSSMDSYLGSPVQMTAFLRRVLVPQRPLTRFFCTPSTSAVDERYDSLLREAFSNTETLPEHWGLQAARGTSSHDFMVVHPKVRWGSSSASKLKDPQRQLDEAVTLVNTLPGFRVVE
ncbi:unnamed protein product [Strongylus vulgaris]|uniref:Uncharacterized protein n=1 Tax=Strongylus vulgaris TaxID=40348 RepID=A0A3P7K8S7_STRVU|nr:unnamed protein product [Strongylus vulgaris]